MTKEELKKLAERYVKAFEEWDDDYDRLEKQLSNINACKINYELLEKAQKLGKQFSDSIKIWVANGYKS